MRLWAGGILMGRPVRGVGLGGRRVMRNVGGRNRRGVGMRERGRESGAVSLGRKIRVVPGKADEWRLAYCYGLCVLRTDICDALVLTISSTRLDFALAYYIPSPPSCFRYAHRNSSHAVICTRFAAEDRSPSRYQPHVSNVHHSRIAPGYLVCATIETRHAKFTSTL